MSFHRRGSSALVAALCVLATLPLVACEDDKADSSERTERTEKELAEAREELDEAKNALAEAEEALEGAASEEELAKAQSELADAKKELEQLEEGGEPRYLAAISVQTGDTYATYTATSAKLDASIVQEFLKRGLETDAHVAPSAFDGKVYVPGGSKPTLTRFAVEEDGSLSEDGTINFGGVGVQSNRLSPAVGESLISAEKAYLFDEANPRALIWNPTTMELTGKTIDLTEVLNEPIKDTPEYKAQIFVSPGFIKRIDNRMFIPVRWGNWDAEDPKKIFRLSAGLLILDTDKDEVVTLLQDDRLLDTIYTVVTDNGDLYLFTGAYGASFNVVFDLGKKSGALRVKRGEDKFDADYFLDLEKLTGGRAVTSPSGGNGTEFYARVFFEERAEIYGDDGKLKPEISAEPWLIIRAPAWRYYRFDLEGENEAVEIPELPFGATDGYFYKIPEEKRLFIAVIEGLTTSFGGMTLFEIDGTKVTESITVPGALTTLSRLDRKP